MNNKYLVINVTNTTLKFSFYDMPGSTNIISGHIENIGTDDCVYVLNYNGKTLEKKVKILDHKRALGIIPYVLVNNGLIAKPTQIDGIGHKILHGGENYLESELVDSTNIDNIRSLTELGFIREPIQVECIETMQSIFPEVPQVAVFDIGFNYGMQEDLLILRDTYKIVSENQNMIRTLKNPDQN